jgi:hypothetical protein
VRRLLMVLAVVALMAAMMVSTGPAMAQNSSGNESDFDNSFHVVEYNDVFYVYWDDDYWDDCYLWHGVYWC